VQKDGYKTEVFAILWVGRGKRRRKKKIKNIGQELGVWSHNLAFKKKKKFAP